MGTLTLEERGDVTIIDPKKKWRVDSSKFYSKGRNCPFDGLELQGKAETVIIKGELIMLNGKLLK
jgi:dihydroorotase